MGSSRLQTWFSNFTGWFRTGVAAVLKAGGPVPKHIAIVMDGNRRFAQSRNLRRESGHKFGADKLLEVLEWCLALDVRCLSVYAFSTDNFKRSQPEIDVLFALAEEKLDALADSPVIARHRVRVQVLGELRLLPPGLQRAAGHAMGATWHHDGPVLNVCFAYTGREDMAQAVAAVGVGVAAAQLARDAVTEETLERCLYGGAFYTMVETSPPEATASDGAVDSAGVARRGAEGGGGGVGDGDSGGDGDGEGDDPPGGRKHARGGDGGCGGVADGVGGTNTHAAAAAAAAADGSLPVDLLIRTSGETRLSDFILWGTSQHAVLCFLEVLWPDFSFTDMCHSVWVYQRSAAHALSSRGRFLATRERERARQRERAAASVGGSQSPRLRRGHRAGGAGAGERGGEEGGGTTVAWVKLKGEVRQSHVCLGDGGAGAFLANRNRRVIKETLRMAAIEKTAQ